MRGRPLAVIGAASSIGIRPYDGTREARHLDRAPRVLRELGVAVRLGAADLGDVIPPAYRDFSRPPGGIRNEPEVAQYSHALGDRISSAIADGRFPVVIGGDCSIVLGSLLGLSRHAGRVGLAYVDGHADFATPQESMTGSAASMCLALAVGRGASPLAALGGGRPLVRAEDVALVGRRDDGQSYGHAALARSGILDVPGGLTSAARSAATARSVLERLGHAAMDGFWIHIDADVLNPDVMPAVDSPEPGGPGIEELCALVAPLARHPKACGIQVTIYDPKFDGDRSCAMRLLELLAAVLTGPSPEAGGVE